MTKFKNYKDKVLGYAAILGFASGTVWAITLEAQKADSSVVYILGAAVVVFGLDKIRELINK